MIELEPSSERVIEDEYLLSDSAYIVYLFHLATYRFAATHVVGKRVLDLGCGSGYGSKILAEFAADVTGVDVAKDAVTFAEKRYVRSNLKFQPILPDGRLPFESQVFDVVTSFQVIEHVSDASDYLAEAKRVLAPDGLLIVATPDRRHRLFPLQKPWNPWHLKEYEPKQFESLLKKHFRNVSIFGMSATPEMIGFEIQRYARMRLLSLPFTLPITPEWLRTSALRYLSARRLQSTKKITGRKLNNLNESNVKISKDISPSVNIVALAQNG